MKKFTGIVASEKTVEAIELLRAEYPEGDKLLNELFDCITYGIACREDACTYTHAINAAMDELFYSIENDSLDDRDLSDAEYAAAISEIKGIAADLDSYIDDYINDLICEFDLYA